MRGTTLLGPRLGSLTTITVAAALVVGPAIGVIRAIVRNPMQDSWAQAAAAFSAITIATTVIYALAIGVVACTLAWPVSAWLAGADSPARRARRLTLMLAPLLLPNYLPYAGWGLLRGPNTVLGDYLARQDPGWSVLAGKLTALGGMALWSWPLAALVLAAGRDRLASGLMDLARLDNLTWFQRSVVLVRAMRGPITTAILLVGLVMVGSAIPLHVAQVPTYAIELWKAMQLSTSTAGLWLAAAPLVLVAVAAAVVLSRAITHQPSERPEAANSTSRVGRLDHLLALSVWGLAVLIPLGLFAESLHSWRSVPMFWRISGSGVAQSVRTGGWVGLAAIGILLCTWAAVDSARRFDRAAARWALLLLTAAGLLPGVLVGAAVNLGLPASDLSVIAAHLLRFGWMAAAAGWWLARQEPTEQRWLRLTEGGPWLSSWFLLAVRPRLASVLGVGLATAALSIHEMESTVFVLAPGSDNLAQQLLDYLHYARDEQLSAAAVNLLGCGVVVALVVAWLIARTTAEPPPRGRS